MSGQVTRSPVACQVDVDMVSWSVLSPSLHGLLWRNLEATLEEIEAGALNRASPSIRWDADALVVGDRRYGRGDIRAVRLSRRERREKRNFFRRLLFFPERQIGEVFAILDVGDQSLRLRAQVKDITLLAGIPEYQEDTQTYQEVEFGTPRAGLWGLLRAAHALGGELIWGEHPDPPPARSERLQALLSQHLNHLPEGFQPEVLRKGDHAGAAGDAWRDLSEDASPHTRWCVAQVANALDVADAEMLQWIVEHKHEAAPTQSLSTELWLELAHHARDLYLSQAFALIASSCQPLFSYELERTWGLSQKDALPLHGEDALCQEYRQLAQWLHIDVAPKLYKHTGVHGVRSANVTPRALLVGSNVLDASVPERIFSMARQLALSVPAHRMAGLQLPIETLRLLLMGGFFARLNEEPPGTALDGIIDALQEMSEDDRAVLNNALMPYVGGVCTPVTPHGTGHDYNVPLWCCGVDLSADRFGLLACDDLRAAYHVIRSESSAVSTLSADQRCAELAAFVLSPLYERARAEVREALS